MTLGLAGQLIGGVVLGALGGWWLWRRLRKAEDDRLKAAGQDAYIKGYLEARRQEAEAHAATLRAIARGGRNPGDWR